MCLSDTPEEEVNFPQGFCTTLVIQEGLCCKFLPIDGVRILFLNLNCAPRILVLIEQRALNSGVKLCQKGMLTSNKLQQ